ncbi:MAG: hypothetical protein A2Z99_10480 [Treponema sp. GWB1_62_6]|nr:MAG: hypothetical protein A2Z99_10480 [Treponema sp. GWB1_62_6]
MPRIGDPSSNVSDRAALREERLSAPALSAIGLLQAIMKEDAISTPNPPKTLFVNLFILYLLLNNIYHN